MNMRLQVRNGCVVNYLKWTLDQNWCGYHLEAGQDCLLRFFNYVVSRSGNRISELRSISRNFLFNNNYLVLIFINIVAINFQERRYAFVNSMQREIIQSGRENYAGPSITLFFQQSLYSMPKPKLRVREVIIQFFSLFSWVYFCRETFWICIFFKAFTLW